MGEDADQNNKQQNPDEEPMIDENETQEEPQASESKEINAGESSPEKSDEPDSEMETSDSIEEKSSDEQGQDMSDEELAENSEDETTETDTEKSADEELSRNDPPETPAEEVLQDEDVDTETTELDVEEDVPANPESEQIIEPEAEPHDDPEAPAVDSAEEPETTINSEEAEEELLSGMPPDTIVEEEKTEIDALATEAENLHEEDTVSTDSNSNHTPVVVIVALLVGLLMVTVAFMAYQSTNNESVVEDTASQIKEDEKTVVERKMLSEMQAKLSDVTTNGAATGTVSAKYYDDDAYELVADFSNLPDRATGEFFEGWLVNQTTEEFLSTGVVEYMSDGQVLNNFSATQDYQTQGYTFYVLTLEPDDDDPAPAKHILEGTLEIAN